MSITAQPLSSAANPLLKQIRRAVASGGAMPGGGWVAESVHLLDEALRSGVGIRAVICSEPAWPALRERFEGRSPPPVKIVAPGLFAGLASTETSQGVLTIVEPPLWRMDDLFRPPALVVALDGVRDPGNAGTITRSAEALGATGIVYLKGTVSPANPKTLRASAGSLFRLPFLAGIDAEACAAECRQRRVAIFSASPAAGDDPRSADLSQPSMLVFGSESRGVSAALTSASRPLRIATSGVESLNVSAAAAIMLHEASRQRGTRDGNSRKVSGRAGR